MKDRSVWRAAVGWTLALLAGAPAFGQTTVQTEPTRQQLNPQGQVAPITRRQSGDLFSPPVAEPCVLPADASLTFRFQGVDITGASRLSAADVHSVESPFAGRDVTPAAICEMRDEIALRLFRRGVLARVVIPKQKIDAGRVKFLVIEAQIVSVRFHGDIGPAQAKAEAYLNHLQGLAPFDLNTAQRYLLLVNDIPGVGASAAISHSTAPGAPGGGLDLDVQLVRKAIDAVAAVQNTSSDTLGPWSGVVRADFNSFTSFGERTSLVGYTTLGNNSQEVIQILEQARIGSTGWFVQGSFAYGRSHPEGVLSNLNLRGDSYVGTVEVHDPVVRLEAINLTLGAGFDLIDQHTVEPNGATVTDVTDDKLRVVWLRADADAKHAFDRAVLGNFISSDAALVAEVRKGLDALGSSGQNAPALSRVEGRSDAWVVRVEGHGSVRADPIGKGLPIVLSAHFAGQWADRPLLAYEEQAIGNLTIGRGYDPAAASGDRVIAGEIKALVGPVNFARRAGFSPYIFYDIAEVTNLDTASQDVTLRSLGGGVEFHLPFNFQGDVYYAKPLDRPYFAAATKPPGRVIVQLSLRY